MELVQTTVTLSHTPEFSLENGESAEGSVFGDNLDVNSVRNDLSVLLEVVEFLLCVLGESELSANSDLLSAWEFEHRSSESFFCVLQVLWANSDGHNDGTDINSG